MLTSITEDDKMSMDLYLLQLSDGDHIETRLVAALRESVASSYGSLQAARLSRMVQRTWRVHSVAKISEVEVADDQEKRMKVRLDD